MIRLANLKDAPALLAIYAPFIEQTVISFEYTVPTVAEFAERVQSVLTQLPWLVYEQNGQIAGYAYASKHRDRTAYQWSADTSVYIHPKFHRQGIARSLYIVLLDLLRKQGYYNAYAGITSPNEKSERFHESMGFTRLGNYEKVGYKFGEWHDVQWYNLVLQPHAAAPIAPVAVHTIWAQSEYAQ